MSDLHQLFNVSDSVCKRQMLKVNINKSKIMVFQRSKSKVVDFACPYRVRAECPKECEIRLNGERMQEVHEFKYLGLIMCKHGSMDGETKERAEQGRDVAGSLGCIMKGRTVSMDVKKGLRDGITVPTITCASMTWVWNERQRSRIQAVEMSYLRSAWEVQKMDGESNESVYNRSGMSSKGEGMKCGVVEGVKHNTLRWFGHMERMTENVITKSIYEYGRCGGCKGMTSSKMGDGMLEYVRERGKREEREDYSMQRGNARIGISGDFCHSYPLTRGALRNWHQIQIDR